MGRQGTSATEPATTVELPSLLTPEELAEVVRSLRLPPRQASIVGLVLQGKQDKEIAAALGLRRSTVRTYLGRIFICLGVPDRVGLVLCICANHLKSRRREGCHPHE